MRVLLIGIFFLLLSGCTSITGSNFYQYNVYILGQGDVSGDVRIVPVDKSTQGAVTSAQTTTPTLTATIPVVP